MFFKRNAIVHFQSVGKLMWYCGCILGWSGSSNFTHLHPFNKLHYFTVTTPCIQCRSYSTVTTLAERLEPVAFAQREWTMNTPYSVIGQAAHSEQWTPPSRLAPCLIMTTSTTTDSTLLLWPTWMYKCSSDDTFQQVYRENDVMLFFFSCYIKKAHVAYLLYLLVTWSMKWHDVVLLPAPKKWFICCFV